MPSFTPLFCFLFALCLSILFAVFLKQIKLSGVNVSWYTRESLVHRDSNGKRKNGIWKVKTFITILWLRYYTLFVCYVLWWYTTIQNAHYCEYATASHRIVLPVHPDRILLLLLLMKIADLTQILFLSRIKYTSIWFIHGKQQIFIDSWNMSHI